MSEKNRDAERMNREGGADAWGSQRPETPPWDAAEYSQLISAGPLLPLLERYAGIGMIHDNKKRTFCHLRNDEDDILLMSYTPIFLQVLMTKTLSGGPHGKFSHKALTLTNVRATNLN